MRLNIGAATGLGGCWPTPIAEVQALCGCVLAIMRRMVSGSHGNRPIPTSASTTSSPSARTELTEREDRRVGATPCAMRWTKRPDNIALAAIRDALDRAGLGAKTAVTRRRIRALNTAAQTLNGW